jgi:hypothetical protein
MTTNPNIHSVYVPPPTKVTPGAEIGKKITTDQYWANKANEARAMREYEEERRNIESIRNPAPASEPPIKIGGSIDLGHFDLQEQSRVNAANAEAARVAAENRNAALEAENKKLQSDLIANTINAMQTNLGGQIQKLQADLVAGRSTAKSVSDQLKEIVDNAAMLGYVKPETTPKGPVVQTGTDAAISLEMLRIQLEDKRTERQFAWQMEKDRRNFQLELRKLDQANKLAIAQNANQREKDTLLWKAPEIIGNTIARGLLASRGGTTANTPPIQRRPPPTRQGAQAENIESELPASEAIRSVEAGLGEAGSIECPECSQPIAIGPTATQGVCANCEYTVNILRKGGV